MKDDKYRYQVGVYMRRGRQTEMIDRYDVFTTLAKAKKETDLLNEGPSDPPIYANVYDLKLDEYCYLTEAQTAKILARRRTKASKAQFRAENK